MLRSRSLFRSTIVATALVTTLASGLQAANRLRVESVTLRTESTDNVVPVRMDADQNVLGFSIYLEYDASKISITSVSHGAAVQPLEPEWSDGAIDNTRGELVWGVVFDLSGPTLAKELVAGTNLEVLLLTVDVLASSDTTVTLNLTNINSSEPRRVNVIADTEGNAVSPAPSLQDGTVIIEDLAPRIDTASYVDNEGDPGQVFRVAGDNFDQPGLAVTVCGKEADFSLVENGRALEITAPDCSPGPAVLEVCTDFGCDSDDDGFAYSAPPDGPIIEAIVLNRGGPGTKFIISGQNLTESGMRVTVCDNAAEAVGLAEGSVEVTAPTCGTLGFARVEICTDFGCDFDDEGFQYTSTGLENTFRRGDSNEDGTVNITDGIATLGFLFTGRGEPPGCRDAADANDDGLLNITDPVATFVFLFRGGTPIPPPFGNCGEDPTPDAIPCEMTQDTCP